MRLIDADKFISTLKESKECGVDSIATGEIIELINDEPTVESKKGKWIGYDNHVICSECKNSMWTFTEKDMPFNFCPECGARLYWNEFNGGK